jgi:hypothetical protein
LFIDKVVAESRKRKNKLIEELNECLGYEESDYSINQPLSLWYENGIELQAINCIYCGEYCSTGSTNNFYYMTSNAICCCRGGIFQLHHEKIRRYPINMIGWVN